MSPPRVLLSAGEASGDNYGADLIRELRRLRPDVEISGYGGAKMRAAGMELREDLARHAVMGIVRVLKKAPTFLRLLRQIREHLDTWKPDVVVPIDYPGLHFLLAKYATRRKIPVVYYVSPQLWAWAGWRIYKVRRRVSRMLVILPFEEKYYADRGVEVTFVGHPLFDYLRGITPDPSVIESARDGRQGPVLALLPGSREQEIRNNYPTQLRAAAKVEERFPDVTVVTVNSGNDPRLVELLETLGEEMETPLRSHSLHIGSPYDVMAFADAAIVTSGTATIELAFFGTPMVVTYCTTPMTARLGKILTKTDHIALVNILAGREIVPEYFTAEECSGDLARHVEMYFRDERKKDEVKRELQVVKTSMGEQGASERAAKAILEMADGG